MRRGGAQQRAAELVAEQHAVPGFLQRRERAVEPRLAERERRELAQRVVGVREVRRDEGERLLGLDGEQAREALAEHLRLRVAARAPSSAAAAPPRADCRTRSRARRRRAQRPPDRSTGP